MQDGDRWMMDQLEVVVDDELRVWNFGRRRKRIAGVTNADKRPVASSTTSHNDILGRIAFYPYQTYNSMSSLAK
jgi:hypothetical protein